MANPLLTADQLFVPGFLQWGTHALRPAATGTGYYYAESDTGNLCQDQGAWVTVASVGGGGGFDIPILTSDPVSPTDGEMWNYREEIIHADGEIMGALGMTYQSDPGVIKPLKLSVNDAGVIRRIDYS